VTCYKPLNGFKRPNGKITLKWEPGVGQHITVPCGGCIGCRIDNAREWTIRCMHEAQSHQDNSFITLTYSNEHLPIDTGLDKKHFQQFMKNLRQNFPTKKIRYYMVGEYGDKNMRPHYHACLFGLDFTDKMHFKRNENRGMLYTSPTLDRIWTKGFSTIGTVTWQSAGYCARYIMKKVKLKDDAQKGTYGLRRYERVDQDTGITIRIQPEYNQGSLKPGIGHDWFKKYTSDVFPADFIVINAKKYPVPKYYDKLYERSNPEEMIAIRQQREIYAKLHQQDKDKSTRRLEVREKIQELNHQKQQRTLEDNHG